MYSSLTNNEVGNDCSLYLCNGNYSFYNVIQLRQQIALTSQEKKILQLFNIHKKIIQKLVLYIIISVYKILVFDNIF